MSTEQLQSLNPPQTQEPMDPGQRQDNQEHAQDHFEVLDLGTPRTGGRRVGNLLFCTLLFLGAVAAWRCLGGPKNALASHGWLADWDAAVEQARVSGKPALVLFTADWCPGCKQLESEILSQSQVKQFLRDNYTLVMVDLSDRSGSNNERAREFGVSSIPTIVLYDKSGKEKARCNGMPADELLAWLRR